METENENKQPDYLTVIAKLINVILILLMIIIILVVIHFTDIGKDKKQENAHLEQAKVEITATETPEYWKAPDSSEIKRETNAELILYGKDLIANTANYYGPAGKIVHSTNGMNCQNCHLKAGAQAFGNNYAAVASTYPKFRARSGTTETIAKRVNDCFERSLNGKAIDSSGKEMQAIISYIKWLGKNVAKGEKPPGSGLKDLAYMERPADPEKGKLVYIAKCMKCHTANGEGEKALKEGTYRYPPLWGEHSYNIGAGLYRISRFAAYVKYNMPEGATYEKPQLSDEEAWDVAAFVNSQPRPVKDLSKDWPDISGKPVDHPFGPYADKFSETQHKYGPFEAILAKRK